MAASLLNVFSYAGFVLAACGLFSLYAGNKLVPQWNRRHFAILRNHWTKIFAISLGSATVATAVLASSNMVGFAPVIFGGLTFFMVFASITDAWISYAPREITGAAIIWAFLGMVGTIVWSVTHGQAFPTVNLIEVGLWFAFLLVLLVIVAFSKGHGFGSADFELFAAIGFSYVFFYGVTNIAYCIFAASAIQLVNFGIRKIVSLKTGKAKGGKTLPYLPALCGVVLVAQFILAFQ